LIEDKNKSLFDTTVLNMPIVKVPMTSAILFEKVTQWSAGLSIVGGEAGCVLLLGAHQGLYWISTRRVGIKNADLTASSQESFLNNDQQIRLTIPATCSASGL
jgi:hypothetical protein